RLCGTTTRSGEMVAAGRSARENGPVARKEGRTMRLASRILAVVAVLFLAASAHAQPPGTRVTKQEKDYGPYGVYGPGLTYKPPTVFVTRPVTTTIAVGTSVSVPDRGEVLLGGY